MIQPRNFAAGWIESVQRFASAVVAGLLLATAVTLNYTIGTIGVYTDTAAMLSRAHRLNPEPSYRTTIGDRD